MTNTIIIVFVILQCLNSLAFDLTTGNQTNGKSILAVIGKRITPIFKPLGIKEENWPASVGIFTGVFAKEAVVGTLNSLYLSIETHKESGQEEREINIAKKIKSAFLTIPENISNIAANLFNPIWLNLSDQEIIGEYLETESISGTIYKSMQRNFDGRIGAFAYLLFILLYFPCVSVFGIMVREIGMKWAIFSALWSTSVAYIVSVIFYQAAKVYIAEGVTAMHLSMGILVAITIFILMVSAQPTQKSKC